MDALTQLLEPFVCSTPNALVDAICREALPRAIASLPRAYRRRERRARPRGHGLREPLGRHGPGERAPRGGPWLRRPARRRISHSPWRRLRGPSGARRRRQRRGPCSHGNRGVPPLARYARPRACSPARPPPGPRNAGPALARLAAELESAGSDRSGYGKRTCPKSRERRSSRVRCAAIRSASSTGASGILEMAL